MTTQNMDKKINELLAVVAKQRADLTHVEKMTKAGWKTKCCAVLNNKTVNLATLQHAEVIDLLAEILLKAEYLNQAKAMLKVESDTKVFGHTVEEWVTDCEKRMAMLTLNEKKDKLQKVEAQLNTLLSPELQKIKQLEALEKELTK